MIGAILLTNGVGSTIHSDCQSAITQALSKRRKQLQSPCYQLIMACREIHKGYPNVRIVKVRAHPEKYCPDTTSWTQHMWGNYLADHAASENYHAMDRHGVCKEHDQRVLHTSITTSTIMTRTTVSNKIGWSDHRTGTAARTSLSSLSTRTELQSYLENRETVSATLGHNSLWSDLNLPFSTRVLNLSQISFSQRAGSMRTLWDKRWHGRNRSKIRISLHER